MAGNTAPIFTRVGDLQWAVAITAANTAKDGTGTVTTVFTADATNGGFVRSVRAKPAGTNVASVLRVFVNNGLTNATPANNWYHEDISLPATTISEVAGQPTVEIPLNIAIPPGYKLNVTLGTAVAAGWIVGTVGGKY